MYRNFEVIRNVNHEPSYVFEHESNAELNNGIVVVVKKDTVNFEGNLPTDDAYRFGNIIDLLNDAWWISKWIKLDWTYEEIETNLGIEVDEVIDDEN